MARVLDRLRDLNSHMVQGGGHADDWYVERMAEDNPRQKEVMLSYIKEAKGDD